MSTLSAVVITLNEERNITDCLNTVSWADERIIVDSGSSDSTVLLAQTLGARVFTRPFTNYSDQKNFALAQATCDWVLSLDADERVTPELADEIKRAIADPGDAVGFYIPRLDRMLGRWMRHGLWWPQYKLRLIKSGSGQWQRDVHEVLVVNGPARHLQSPLLHYASDTISQFVHRADRYTTMEAEAWHAAGIRPSLWKMLLYPPGLFLYSYIWRRGLLDGMEGLILAMLMSYYTFLKRAKLWELNAHRCDEVS
jgi:glycosyltransferase involved in cell wall biosynthesis